MSDAKGAAAGQRDRSPSFPFIPLKVAVERLIQFESHHKRAPVPPDRVGPAWGMKTNTSQAQQTLAALRAYGFLETQRGSNGRVVVLSDDARTYLRAQQESVKQQVLRRAALRPKQIETYWREWGDDRPKDPACLDALILHGGFSQDGAEKFLRVYDATIDYAGPSDSDKMEADQEDLLEPDEQERKVAEPRERVDPSEKRLPPLVRQPLVHRPPMTAGSKQDVFSLPEGEVVLQWPEPLTPESFEDFESWLKLVLRKVRRAVQEKAEPDIDDARTSIEAGEAAHLTSEPNPTPGGFQNQVYPGLRRPR